MEPDSHALHMFEHYLYDYLMKRNMHQTAEIFKNEVNLQLDLNAPSTIDVPEGFLLELWSTNYDYDSFRAWVQMQDKQGLEASQGCNTSQQAVRFMKVEAKNQLPDNFTPAFNRESNPIPTHELLGTTSKIVNVTNTNGKEVEPFVQNASQAESATLSEETDPVIKYLLNSFWLFEQDGLDLFDKSIVGESSRNMMNSPERGEGNTNMNEFVGLNAPTVKDDDNTSETSDCFSFLRNIITDGDTSMDNPVESNKEA